MLLLHLLHLMQLALGPEVPLREGLHNVVCPPACRSLRSRDAASSHRWGPYPIVGRVGCLPACMSVAALPRCCLLPQMGPLPHRGPCGLSARLHVGRCAPEMLPPPTDGAPTPSWAVWVVCPPACRSLRSRDAASSHRWGPYPIVGRVGCLPACMSVAALPRCSRVGWGGLGRRTEKPLTPLCGAPPVLLPPSRGRRPRCRGAALRPDPGMHLR